MPSESTEMYLITAFRLSEKRPQTHINDMASALGLHHSSVSEKVKRLVEHGYIDYEADQGVSLTSEGRRIAVNVLRKHRLIKTFLVNMAGYPIDEVYDEACKLEHVISERLTNSLEKLLGFPESDPHGYPIPSHDGHIVDTHYRTLNDFGPGEQAIIKRVDALQQDKLSYLRELGLLPGTQVLITGVEPFDGPIMLDVGGRTVPIAPSLAQEIEAEPAP